MTWDTVQQVLRIVLYTVGSYLFGSDVADGASFQGALGGVMAVGAFVWWWAWERTRPAAAPPKP
jgi:hypothetical protein